MEAKLKKQNSLWLVMFLAALAVMIWKLPYGFGGDDEGFYLTVAHRLCLGERLFADEWHLSQLSSFFTFPFVFIYRAIRGSNEGILLASRCVYLIVHSVTAAVVYIKLKKYGIMSIAASILFMLFTPFDMMTCSYNTIALDTLALCCAFAASGNGKGELIPAGAFLACTVVCCPYFAVTYFLYFIVCFVCGCLYRKNGNECFGLFSWKAFGWATLGIGIVFVLFLVFFFSHTSIKEILSALSGVFSDPEHPTQSLLFKLMHYLWCVVYCHPAALLPSGLYAALLAALAADRKRAAHALLYMTASAAVSVIWLCLFIPELTAKYFNGIMLPLLPTGLTAYILIDNKPRELFAGFFVSGIIYSICVCSTSNMGFDILTIGFSVVNIASLIFIGIFVCEYGSGSKRKAPALVCSVPVLLLFTLVLTVKITHCFWDASPSRLGFKMDRGPAKGIVTNGYFKNSYDLIFEDMREYAGKEDSILVYSQQAWEYLIPDTMPYASFSAWLSGLDDKTENRLELYYEMNPEKIPRYIYIPKTSAFGELYIASETVMQAAESHGYSFEETGTGYKLEKEHENQSGRALTK